MEIPSHAHPLITFQPSDFPDSPRLPFVSRVPTAPLRSPSLGLKAFDPCSGWAEAALRLQVLACRVPFPTLPWHLGAPARGARSSSPSGFWVRVTPSEAWPLPRDPEASASLPAPTGQTRTRRLLPSFVFHCLLTILMDLKYK